MSNAGLVALRACAWLVALVILAADAASGAAPATGFRRATFWFVQAGTPDVEIQARAGLLAHSGIDGVILGGGRHHYLHDDLPYLDQYIEAAARIVRACHTRGIQVAEHHSVVLTARQECAREHAAWIQRDFATGEASVWPEYKTYAFCPNNPEFREHYWKIAKDLVQRIGADALMSDDTVFHHGCGCASCAKRWREEVGGDIREAYQQSRKPGTHEWRVFNDVRRRWYADFRAWLRARQQRELPGVRCVALIGSITSAWGGQTHGGSVEGGLDTADIALWEIYNPADFYSWRRLSAEAAAVAEASRVRGVIPLCLPYGDTAEKRDVFDPEEEVFMWGLARAHGMPFALSRIFLTGLTNADTPRDYFIFERDHLGPFLQGEPAATVGILFSHYSRDNDPKWEGSHSAPAMAWAEALTDDCVPWRAVTDETLDHPLPARIRTLVMPNVFALSDAHLTTIETFVRQGGRLVASGTPAVCNESGDAALPLRGDRLERLFGARIHSAELGLGQESITITSASRFGVDTNFFSHRFGKGRVLYAPSLIETAAFQESMNSGQPYRDLRNKNRSRALAKFVSEPDDSQPVRIARADPDAHVLTTVHRSGRRLLICVLNCAGADLPSGNMVPTPSRVVWASPVELTFSFAERPASVRLISMDPAESKSIPHQETTVSLRTPRRFGLVVADY